MTENKFIIFTDGGARGNPGPAAIGVVVNNDRYGEYIGETTNNVAEYKAVIFALRKVAETVGVGNEKNAKLVIHTDSELIARQLTGKYKVKQSHLQELHDIATPLIKKFGSVEFVIIRRETNTIADGMVNVTLDNR